MKKMILGRVLLMAGLTVMGAGNAQAQQAGQKQDRKEQKQTTKDAEGALKFAVAEQALKERNFVLETYRPASTATSRICYNFLRMEGDKVFTQGIWGTSTVARFQQSEGIVTKFTMQPDKKGNIKIYIEADMSIKEGGYMKGTWPLKLNLKLFKNTNSAPVPGGREGYIVLPSQAHILWLKGGMRPSIPREFF